MIVKSVVIANFGVSTAIKRPKELKTSRLRTSSAHAPTKSSGRSLMPAIQ